MILLGVAFWSNDSNSFVDSFRVEAAAVDYESIDYCSSPSEIILWICSINSRRASDFSSFDSRLSIFLMSSSEGIIDIPGESFFEKSMKSSLIDWNRFLKIGRSYRNLSSFNCAFICLKILFTSVLDIWELFTEEEEEEEVEVGALAVASEA